MAVTRDKQQAIAVNKKARIDKTHNDAFGKCFPLRLIIKPIDNQVSP